MVIFALTFPLLFIFHDLEEIIGMKHFINRNADMLQSRFPFLYKRFKYFTTEGFALAVMEEFVVFTEVSYALRLMVMIEVNWCCTMVKVDLKLLGIS